MYSIFNAQVSNARGDLADLEVHVNKAEEDRANKEHQMRSLNDEIANKEFTPINNLNIQKFNILLDYLQNHKDL